MNSSEATPPGTSERLQGSRPCLKASAAPFPRCRDLRGLHLCSQIPNPFLCSQSAAPQSVHSSVATMTLHMYTSVLAVSLLTIPKWLTTREWLTILAIYLSSLNPWDSLECTVVGSNNGWITASWPG